MGFKELFWKGDAQGQDPSTQVPGIPRPMARPSNSAPPLSGTPAFRMPSTPPPPTRSTPLLQLDVPSKAPVRTATPAAHRDPDPRFQKDLNNALSSASTPGFHEFGELLDAIDDDVKDRPTAIRMTLKGLAKSHKIDKSQVLAAMRERLKILEAERTKFDTDIAEEAQQATANRRQEVDDAKGRIRSIDAQIAQLQAQRAEAERVVQEAERYDNALATKVADVRDRFKSAFTPLSEGLTQLINEVQASDV